MMRAPFFLLMSAGVLGLGGCDSSARFGGYDPRLSSTRPTLAPEPVTPAPTPQVQASPLGAPGGVNTQVAGLPPQQGGPTVLTPGSLNAPGLPNPPASQVPGQPGLGTTAGVEAPPGQPYPNDPNAPPPAAPATPPRPAQPKPPPKVAAVDPAAPAGPPTRSGVTGNWTASEANGGKCKVTLSSAPALDLYKASSAGCNSRDLQRVSAWELRGNEIYLYESGGAVAARLQGSGGRFDGSTSKSGAPVSLTK